MAWIGSRPAGCVRARREGHRSAGQDNGFDVQRTGAGWTVHRPSRGYGIGLRAVWISVDNRPAGRRCPAC